VPLSEHEQRLLNEIEQALYAEDPKFAASVRSARPRSRVRMMLALSVIGVLAGLAVIVVGLATQIIPLGVVGFVLIVGSCVLAAGALRGPRQGAQLTVVDARRGNTAKAKSPTLRAKMEDRMRRRFEER